MLLIDDIQFIAGKGSTQEEFLHTINEIVESGARLLIRADRAPHMLDAVDPRILSRLAGGLVADIQDRKSVVSGKCVSVRVDLGGSRTSQTKHLKQHGAPVS